MRLYEKILIGLVLLLFGIQLLPDYTGKGALFGLGTWLLALSYLIGGYWLLNSKDNKKYFIPIVAGLAFATSISVLPFTIRISKESIFEILPLLNAGLFLGLGIYLLIKRNSKDIVRYHKSIFIRSAIILTVVGFFSYTPVSFKPYRYILIALNNGNDYLVSNMKMFNYTEEFEDALKRGDCERAIDNAKKANEAGKKWLGISTEEENNSRQVEDAIKMQASDSTKPSPELNNLLNNFSSQSQLSKISGTYSNLYKAYKCKADEYYKKSDYEQALSYYLKADKSLNACDHNSEYWDIEQAYSLNLIALCYKNSTIMNMLIPFLRKQ